MKQIMAPVAFAAMLSGCQSAQQSVGNKEDLLAAAGFPNPAGELASPPRQYEE